MPPKTILNNFLTFTLSVEKKINQLGTYLENLEDEEHVGKFQQRILLTHADRLGVAMDSLESKWENLRRPTTIAYNLSLKNLWTMGKHPCKGQGMQGYFGWCQILDYHNTNATRTTGSEIVAPS